MSGGGGVKDTTAAQARVRERNARLNNAETDTVSWYLNEIQRHPTLEHDDSVAVFKQYNEATSEGAKNLLKTKLINSNLRLVVSIAKLYRKSGIPMEDLIQEGNLGLIKAVERYDYTKGFRFSTYATWWIRQHIGQHVLKRRKTIRLPAHAAGVQRKMISAAEKYRDEHGQEPTAEELSELIQTSPRIVKATQISGRQVVSLSSPLTGDANSDTIGDTIADTSQRANPFDQVSEAEMIRLTREVLHELTPKEAAILRLRFGITEDPQNSESYPVTQEELEAMALNGEGLKDPE